MEEFSQQWNEVPHGAALYTFVAYANPDDGVGQELGQLVVDEGCSTSKYGDAKLFFQHQRVEEDIALRPEWESAYMTEC